ncbi:hypothetical protein [Cognatishimia activa]|uniref:DUF1330 domain-containing protein n=1 Tax=Cognatishimia activa TaxID=1715691 RepID=A0A0P1IRZ8_9RHOB|nr:hypothetical protein [Cognatishimia activa]MEE2943834.1 hypothetical protein [Pseudomonadota bacterium]CUI99736.1 hypothetical protein TA5113_01992 [Cognatishimia activa]CUK26225.1 hypothetical protein TA5114_02033 [Cognatishimia activa]
MKLKALVTALLMSVVGTASLAEKAKSFVVLDILPLKDGATLEQAYDYFKGVEPIFAKYDFHRSDAALEVLSIPRGPVTTDVVNLWATDNPQAAFDGIFADKDYLENHVPLRDSIFDLQAATIIVTKRGDTITTPTGKVTHP